MGVLCRNSKCSKGSLIFTMNNESVMREFAKSDESLLEKYDASRKMYQKLMDKSLEQRFQQWINRQCGKEIVMYEDCVSDKWPWQLKQCKATLDNITKCRLQYNTKEQRADFLEKERSLLQQMDDDGETLFDHELYTPKFVK